MIVGPLKLVLRANSQSIRVLSDDHGISGVIQVLISLSDSILSRFAFVSYMLVSVNATNSSKPTSKLLRYCTWSRLCRIKILMAYWALAIRCRCQGSEPFMVYAKIFLAKTPLWSCGLWRRFSFEISSIHHILSILRVIALMVLIFSETIVSCIVCWGSHCDLLERLLIFLWSRRKAFFTFQLHTIYISGVGDVIWSYYVIPVSFRALELLKICHARRFHYLLNESFTIFYLWWLTATICSVWHSEALLLVMMLRCIFCFNGTTVDKVLYF